MRRVPATVTNFGSRTVMRVTSLSYLASEWNAELVHLVPVESTQGLRLFWQYRQAGMTNVYLLSADPKLAAGGAHPHVLGALALLDVGDVVEVTPGRDWMHVLFREADQHHTVFLTNRCNSRCVMCSQPPTSKDDSWLITEAIQVAQHIRHGPSNIGFTGGEPLILGANLLRVLSAYAHRFPGIRMEILTNGRLLGTRKVAAEILPNLPPNIAWMVPLYGHADFLHDAIVQAEGAFDATLEGLLQLQAHQQWIQLRVVLIKPVLEHLPDLMTFVSKNLPFVGEVALMGCEPIGIALAHQDICRVDIRAWHPQLESVASHLTRTGIPLVLMNLPLCSLPQSLWPYASRSISDWKQSFVDECESCMLQSSCCGLFAWHAKGWRPTRISPLRESR